MRPPALPATDRLLSLDEVGKMLRATGRHLRAKVAASPTLRAGRRYSGRRAQFLESFVVRYMHHEMPAAPPEAPVERIVPCLTASIGQRIVTRSGRTVRVVAVSWANQDKPEYVVVDAQGRESIEHGHAWIAGRVEVA